MTSPLAKKIDKLADKHGIAARHVARRPDLLAEIGIDVDDVSEELIREAAAYGETQTRHIAHKYGLSFSSI